MSFSRTGPLTFLLRRNGQSAACSARPKRAALRHAASSAHLMMERVESSMNSTRTWVTPPREPVRPRTLTTLASLTWVLVDSYRAIKDGSIRTAFELALDLQSLVPFRCT